MFIAHIVLGWIGGLLIAGWAWLGTGSIWWAIAVFALAGNAICLTSAGMALILAAIPGRRADTVAAEAETA